MKTNICLILFARFGIDTAENGPPKVWDPRSPLLPSPTLPLPSREQIKYFWSPSLALSRYFESAEAMDLIQSKMVDVYMQLTGYVEMDAKKIYILALAGAAMPD